MAGKLFKTQTAARLFLEERGYAIGKSAFNNHVQAGFIGVGASGQFEEEALLNYAEARLANRVKLASEKAIEAKSGETSASEDVKRKQAEWIGLKLARERGEVMPRADFDAEMAARAQFFAGELRQIAPRIVPQVVALVGGDESKIGDAVRLMEEEILSAMDAWSADRAFVVELPDA